MIVAASEYGRSCYKNICSSLCNGLCILLFHTTINLNTGLESLYRDHIFERFDFIQAVVNEVLTPKPGIDTHNQNKID